MKGLHHKHDKNHFDRERNDQRLSGNEDQLPWKSDDPAWQPILFAPDPPGDAPVRRRYRDVAISRGVVKVSQCFAQPTERPLASRRSYADHTEYGSKRHLKTGVFKRCWVDQ